MKKTIWIPVLVTGLVLGVAGMPRTTWRTAVVLADRWREAAVPVVERLGEGGAAAFEAGVRAARSADPRWIPIGAALLVIAPLSAVLLLAVRARRPRPRRVIDLARRGHHPADIARRTGLAQDAVRSVLRPRTR